MKLKSDTYVNLTLNFMIMTPLHALNKLFIKHYKLLLRHPMFLPAIAYLTYASVTFCLVVIALSQNDSDIALYLVNRVHTD